MQKSDCFVISSDKSLNDYTQNCQMDILIRYFDHVEDRVKLRYLDSKLFWTCFATHQDLFIQFTQPLFKLDTNKMFQERPDINLKFPEKLQKDVFRE